MEFAIIVPVLLLMAMAAIDLGRVFMGWVVLNNAARVGANYAALHSDAWDSPGDAADQATYANLVMGARDDAAVALSGCNAEAIPAPAFPNGTSIGDFAEVVLDCDFQPITPLIGAIFASTGDEFGVSARSVFPIRTGLVDGAGSQPPPSCLASFTWSPANVVAGEAVMFTDDTPPTSSGWIWNFGDAQGSALQDPSHTYATARTYTVELRSSSNGTPCTPYEVDIAVSEPPPPPPPPPPDSCLAVFTWSPTNPVAGAPVTFADGTPPNASGQDWTFGDGGASSNTASPSHTYATAGTYTVQLNSRSNGKACTPYEVNIAVSAPAPPPGCVIPSFIGTTHDTAQGRWAAAGFTTTVALGEKDKKNQDWIIQSQSIVGGQPAPCNVTIMISESVTP